MYGQGIVESGGVTPLFGFSFLNGLNIHIIKKLN